MKSLHPVHSKTDPLSHWRSRLLPIGLQLATVRTSLESPPPDIALPDFEGQGMVLTFINYKGDLQIQPGGYVPGQETHHTQPAHPGMGLLSLAGRSLRFQSSVPIPFSAISIFIPAEWTLVILRENAHFSKIGQALEEEGNVLTCRLGRRQLSLFSAILAVNPDAPASGGLEVQNPVLSLLEYFLCNRHRSVLGANAVAGIDNEDDLSLIREVESYISEYYCSDTFTVDSILKKTYTSYHRLNFLFKSIHGMTISEYIRNKRIEKSKEMIAANAKSISQIAYEIGYSSISNYILAFKKIYQITPGKYKKQMEV
jgi:AraC-like DNA-binding protein